MPHESDLTRGRVALLAGRTVVVTGPWGSGRTRFSRLLGGSTEPPTPVVDDAHLLSGADAADLAGRLERPHVLTVPDGFVLAPALRRAVTLADAAVVEVGRWTPGEVAEFVAETAGGPLDPSAVERLHRWSGGLPALLAPGPDADRGADDPDRVDPAVRARVVALLEDLDEAERDVLTTLMCTGPVPVLLADRALLAPAVDALLARGLLSERAEGDVPDLAPIADLLWRGAAAWVSPRRAREVRRAMAGRTTPADLARLSLHQRLQVARWASDGDGDVVLVRQGVRPAMLLGDPRSAVDLGRHVLAREPDDPATRELVTIALEALGDHAGATATSSPTAEGGVGASALARHATNIYLATLDADTAHLIAPAVDERAEDGGEGAALLGWMQLLMGDLADACATASPVLGDRTSSVQARVWAGLDVAVADVLRGGGAESLDLLDLSRRIAVAQAAGLTPYSEFQVATSRCVALVRLGRGDEALPEAEAELAGTDDRQLRAAWHGVAGLAARETGRFARGAAHFGAIGDILLGDPYGLGTWASSESAVCAALAGLPMPPAPSEVTPIGLTEALLARNTAWCLATTDGARAAELALEAAGTARRRGQTTHEVLALVDAARWDRAATAMIEVGAVERVDNPLVRAGGTVISALVRRRPDELVGAAVVAGGVGWWVVREELLTVARARLTATGQPVAAARLELAHRPHPWPTPILLGDTTATHLTPREAEIGRLAVDGVTSAAIAVRLSISSRTVDNLLGRVYAKCGVGGRWELAESARRSGGAASAPADTPAPVDVVPGTGQ